MKNLKIPLQNVDEKTIYLECASDFRDKTALNYIDKVTLSAERYKECVPRDIAYLPVFPIKEGDNEKIIKVYSEKFAKNGSIGKKYYEAIMANAEGRCPICGSGKLKNLDHFLPKSKYPLLCVTPANLIPVCRDCNFDKKDEFNTDYYSIPFNPYFDIMEDTWLECDISFFADRTYEISFINGFERAKDESMWHKYEKHLKVYDLNATFCARAEEAIENSRGYNRKLLLENGSEDVIKSLVELKIEFEKVDKNSWRSALYRELLRKATNYCNWLNS